VNRTDRLYALVEELRAVAPRPRSARWLAGRFEVSARTIERDISALQQAGVPIWAEPGRTGGYCLDKARTLPPVNLTPGEAVAMAVALRQLDGSPFRANAGTALRKLVAAMQAGDAAAARDLAGRIHLVGKPGSAPTAPVPRLVADALHPRRVLRIGYADRAGVTTMREIEPLGYVGSAAHWYLMAWCRLRDGLRAFRTDRITTVSVTAEVPPPRPLRREDLDIPPETLRQLTLT
jgi:predicted DNA-binding transcriptional regulator YafY